MSLIDSICLDVRRMSRLLFVHIAKAGGTSLRKLLKNIESTSCFDCLHNGRLIRFESGVCVARENFDPISFELYDIAVLIMRNPLMRLESCYRYFLQGGLNFGGKSVYQADHDVQIYLQKKAPTLSDCVRYLPDIATRIPHFQPASHWLDVLPNPLADLVFTGRQESFDQDLKRLARLLDLDPELFQAKHLNASTIKGNRSTSLDPLSRRLAEQFYAEDFRRFGYQLSPLSPPQLVQYWDHSNPPPELLQRMDHWRCCHPQWSYHRFDRLSAADFIGHQYGLPLQEAFLDIRLPAMQADVFRIAFLQAQAGVWVDAATICRQPLDAWLNRRQLLVLLRRSHQKSGKVSTGVMAAAEPGHPLLKRAWQRISAALLARLGDRVYRDFGPGLLRDLLEQDVALQQGLEMLWEPDFTDQFGIDSSSTFLRDDFHWSKRQQKESLYLSGG